MQRRIRPLGKESFFALQMVLRDMVDEWERTREDRRRVLSRLEGLEAEVLRVKKEVEESTSVEERALERLKWVQSWFVAVYSDDNTYYGREGEENPMEKEREMRKKRKLDEEEGDDKGEGSSAQAQMD